MTITRTCVGCRTRDTTERLVRVVWDKQGIRADLSRTATGRGAYVHRDRRCLDAAVTRKALARALRVAVDSPVIDVLELATQRQSTNESDQTTVNSGVGMTTTQETQR